MLETALKYLPKQKGQIKCFVSELPNFVQNRWLPALGSESDEPNKAIIALCNFIAHPARLPNEQAQQLLNAHKQPFEVLVKELEFLVNYDLVACAEEGQLVLLKGLPAFDGSFPDFDKTIPEAQPERVYLVKGKDALDLFPLHAFTEILQWREERYDFERIAETAPQIYFRPSEKVYLEFVPFSKKQPSAT